MKTWGKATFIYAAAAVLVSGLAAGSAISATTMDRVKDRLSAPLPADPVERYQLGQNAFDNPGPKFQRAHIKAPRGPITVTHEYGTYRNGARVVLPGEPARKKDRMALIRDTRFQNAYDGQSEFAELGTFANVSDAGNFLDGSVETASNTQQQNAAQTQSVSVFENNTETAAKSAGLKTVAVQYNNMEIVDDSPVISNSTDVQAASGLVAVN